MILIALELFQRAREWASKGLPLGLIPWAEGSRETMVLLRLDESGIHVAEYMTEFPPREELRKKLHAAIQIARGQAGGSLVTDRSRTQDLG